MVGLCAPAGYGKSTLLVEWALAEDRRVAWVSLDRFDDDPALLLTLLASAYARVSPGNADLIADVAGLGMSVLGRAAPRLAAVFAASPVPFVLMLDDLHEVQSPDCHDVLSVLMSGVPRGSQLVAASRSEQPHLPRLRASGDALAFVAADLALDAAGAEQIFSRANVSLTREQAATVTARTEGWPVGLYLAALIAGDSPGAGLSISGDDRYVADYLYREALSQLPEGDQRFLRRTAVLDQLCAPLCDALLGEAGAQERLRRLEARSSFLVPLDRRREWYRYHGLFREFLLGELGRVEPDVVAKLHLRAADWYESNGSPAMAVEHLLHTTEQDRCVQLVAALVLPTYQAGQMSTVQRWLAALGDEAVEQYPPLAVLAGYMALFTGQTHRSATMGGDRRRRLVRPGAGGRHSIVRLGAGDVARGHVCRRSRADAGRRQLRGRPGAAVEPMARHGALLPAPRRICSAGDVDQAAALFAEASALAATMSNTDTLRRQRGRARRVGDGSRTMGGGGRPPEARAGRRSMSTGCRTIATSVLAFAGAARLAVHRGDLKEAEPPAHAGDASPADRARLALPWLAVRVRLQLAKVYWAIADHAAARHLLHEIDDVLLHRPALGTLVDEVSEFRQARHVERARRERPARHPSLRLSCGCSRTCRPTSRSARSRSGCSCPATPSTPRSSSIYRKLGVSSRNEAVQQATASVCSAGSRLTRRTGVRRRRRCRSRAPSPASGRPRPRAGARRRERRRTARRRSRRLLRPRSPRHRPAPRRRDQRHRPRPTRRGGRAPASSDRAPRTRTGRVASSSPRRASLMARRRRLSV